MRLTINTQHESSVHADRNEKKAIDLGVAIFFNLLLTLFLLPITGLAQTEQVIKSKFVRAPLGKVNNKYIVILNDDLQADKVEEVAKQLASKYQGKVKATMNSLLKGFIIELDDADAKALSEEKIVSYVEEDSVSQQEFPQSAQKLARPETISQPALSWAIDRVDQKNLPLDGYYDFDLTGAGVNVYILDTGMNVTHVEFQGRVASISDFAGDQISTSLHPGIDPIGHGTGVAAHAAGSQLGVAKLAILHNVRVIDQSFNVYASNLVQALEYVYNHVIAQRALKGGRAKYPAVINLSLGFNGQPSSLPTITVAINNLISLGVTVVAAAGNYKSNAAILTPAGIPDVITVGATNANDSFAANFSCCPGQGSNFGAGVDIFAPGTFMIYPVNTANSGYIGGQGSPPSPFDGTSFASPMVAGAAALYLQNNPTASPQAVTRALVKGATPNKITGLPQGTPNRLLYSRMYVLAVRNAASYGYEVAPESLAVVFGSGFNYDTFLTEIWGPENALSISPSRFDQPWILYWGNSQINYQVNSLLPNYGEVIVGTGFDPFDPVTQGSATVSLVAPGMFSADGAGQGLAAGQLTRVNNSTNNQITEQLSSNGNILTPATETYYLILYGTGLRFRSSLNNVSAKVGSTTVPVAYAGNQNFYRGVDQVNLGPLPASLKGVGTVEIEIKVDGKTANKLQVNLQ